MSVDRLSVTVPTKLGAAMRTLAKARGQTVSTLVTSAIAHEVRMAALDAALADAEERFGPVPAELVDDAERRLLAAMQSARPKPRRRRR